MTFTGPFDCLIDTAQRGHTHGDFASGARTLDPLHRVVAIGSFANGFRTLEPLIVHVKTYIS